MRYALRIARWLLGAAVSLSFFAALATPAQAAFPGQNGKIAFDHQGDIYTVEPDGSGVTRVTTTDQTEWNVSWSPDGSKFVFEAFNGQVCIMNADGSGRTCPDTAVSELLAQPTWSPDGRKIAFVSARLDVDTGAYTWYLLTMNPDGTGLTFPFAGATEAIAEPSWSPDGARIAFSYQHFIHTIALDGTGMTAVTEGSSPDWAPDGSRIAFISTPGPPSYFPTDISTVKPDGSGLTQLTNDAANQYRPAYSPDGKKIVFSSVSQGQPRELRVMNADGSGNAVLTTAPDLFSIYAVSWQPLPGPKGGDFNNSAQFCKAERAFLGERTFAQKYGTNRNGANAFGKCLSGG